MRKLVPSLFTLVVGLAPAGARAETTSCTAIATLPAIISSPGIYCLNKNFAVNMPSGVAISITSPNVVLDLNAHRLANTAGSTTTAIGITAQGRATIKNGAIRGFEVGVRLYGLPTDRTQANRVEDLRIDKTNFPIFSSAPALIQRNWIAEAGPGNGTFAAAIYVAGSESRVIDNDILGVTVAPPGVDAFGVFVTADDVLIVNNRIDDSEVGIQYATGGGKYRDNLTSAVTYPYLGGTDAGNNN